MDELVGSLSKINILKMMEMLRIGGFKHLSKTTLLLFCSFCLKGGFGRGMPPNFPDSSVDGLLTCFTVDLFMRDSRMKPLTETQQAGRDIVATYTNAICNYRSGDCSLADVLIAYDRLSTPDGSRLADDVVAYLKTLSKVQLRAFINGNRISYGRKVVACMNKNGLIAMISEVYHYSLVVRLTGKIPDDPNFGRGNPRVDVIYAIRRYVLDRLSGSDG